jgi:hypothetical protein
MENGSILRQKHKFAPKRSYFGAAAALSRDVVINAPAHADLSGPAFKDRSAVGWTRQNERGSPSTCSAMYERIRLVEMGAT